MLIELYGLSGSGKSTLAGELQHAEPAIKIIKPRKRTTGFLYFVAHNPYTFVSLVARMCYAALIHGDRLLFRHRLAILIGTFEAVGSAQRAQRGIVILEEGLFQRLFSLHERVRSVAELTRLIKLLPPVDLVVIVDRHKEYFARYTIGSQNVRAQQGAEYMEAWKRMILQNHANLQTAISKCQQPAFVVDEQTSVKELLHTINTLHQ